MADPIELLVEELKDDDIETRIAAMKRLRTIGIALGPDRARAELLPFLLECTEGDDEVLMALAEQLGGFVELVGGPQYAPNVLRVLEVLCEVEETCVREKAVISTHQVADKISDDLIQTEIIPIVKRLGSGDWFTPRISSASLIPACYARAGGQQHDLIDLLKLFAQDDMPMVRQAAFDSMAKILPAAGASVFKSELRGLFENLVHDEQDTIRCLLVDNCISIGKIVAANEAAEMALPIARSLSEDNSWRVRLAIAKNIDAVMKALGKSAAASDLADSFEQLLSDIELEVRSAALDKLGDVGAIIGADTVVEKILPTLKELCLDAEQRVRIKLAGALGALAKVLGKEGTKSQVIPLMTKLLEDETTEVRVNVIDSAVSVSEVVGADSISQTVLPKIIASMQDKQWRVREAIVRNAPALGSVLGVDVFGSKLLSLLLEALADSVQKIRSSAVETIQPLSKNFGWDYVYKNFLSKALSLFEEKKYYLHRMTSIYSVMEASSVAPKNVVTETLLPIVIKSFADPVPNIRILACKAVVKIAPFADASALQSRVKARMQELSQDKDDDVRFFAGEALSHM
eukprot:CAMPEP_0113888016 /NCGR_PEP_ID=MMETSP0780_2-20120614/12591_1 /TAXON_ID=652834 /ORGANISM="Palpitomonas bilix" /LENGTH=574 /DNA_ID=CAMNT_0000876725 /DNA_START=146 /DNA_END=1870 /DNA_ORIENTATION=- /assembly_acc=CAM_ASM_000599